MKLSAKRVFYVMIGSTIVLVAILIGAVFAGNVWLKGESNKLLSAKLDNRLIDEQQTAILKANKDIQKYADLERIANSIVPQDKDQARSVREIINLAVASGIPVASISFPASTLGAAAAATSPSSNTSTSDSTTTATKAPAITQVVPVQGINGVYQMLITVQSDSSSPVPYSSLIRFLGALETNRRTAQVDNITITPSQKNLELLTFQVGINVFIKP